MIPDDARMLFMVLDELADLIRAPEWRRCAACAGQDSHEVCDPPDFDALADRLFARARQIRDAWV